MSEPLELDHFLASLRGRRERLLSLARPEESDLGALLAELEELAEQLLVADEELRVQQEELDATRRHLEVVAAEGHTLLLSSSDAQVVTDFRGVVREANRVAHQLVLRPSDWVTPRPIATWFDVSHRPLVRSLISRMAAGDEHQGLKAVLVNRSDDTRVPVSVTVTRGIDPRTREDLLRWELRPITKGTTLRSVSIPASPPGDDDAPVALVSLLAQVNDELSGLDTVDDIGRALERAVLRLVPGAARAIFEPVATDRTQQPGPSPLRIPVRPARQPEGVLVVWPADGVGALEGEAEIVVSALAAYAAAALVRVATEAQLRCAIESRRLIGQAVGILIERHRLTADAAFRRLAQISSENNVKIRHIAGIMVDTGQDPSDAVKR